MRAPWILIVVAACGGTREPGECMFGRTSGGCEPVGASGGRSGSAQPQKPPHVAVNECEAGVKPSCEELWRVRNQPYVSKLDVVRAMTHGCVQLAIAKVCEQLGSFGEELDDASIVRTAYEQHCMLTASAEENSLSCFKAGETYRDGTGGAPDRERAVALWSRSCRTVVDARLDHGCMALGRSAAASSTSASASAEDPLAKRCREGEQIACHDLGRIAIGERPPAR